MNGLEGKRGDRRGGPGPAGGGLASWPEVGGPNGGFLPFPGLPYWPVSSGRSGGDGHQAGEQGPTTRAVTTLRFWGHEPLEVPRRSQMVSSLSDKPTMILDPEEAEGK